MNQRYNSFGSQSSGYHGSTSNLLNGSFNQNRSTLNSSSHSPNSRQNHSPNSSVRPDRPHNTSGFPGSATERQVDQVGTQRNSFNTSHRNSKDRSFNNRQPYNDQGRWYEINTTTQGTNPGIESGLNMEIQVSMASLKSWGTLLPIYRTMETNPSWDTAGIMVR